MPSKPKLEQVECLLDVLSGLTHLELEGVSLFQVIRKMPSGDGSPLEEACQCLDVPYSLDNAQEAKARLIEATTELLLRAARSRSATP